MKCIFKEDETNSHIKICQTCGLRVKSKFPSHQVHSECKAIDDPNVKVLTIDLDFKKPEVQMNKVVKDSEKAEGRIVMPSLLEQAFNFLGAIKDFVANPEFVSEEQYKARLEMCNTCEARANDRCADCGCFLAAKAKGAAFHCPRKKWPGDK